MSTVLANLGELEITVLRHVWKHGASDVKAVHRDIGISRNISHKTIQSTLKRLYEKELLSRRKEGRAYTYTPKVDREELTENTVNRIIEELGDGKLDPALQAFVNIAEQAGEQTLEKLEGLIAERKADLRED